MTIIGIIHQKPNNSLCYEKSGIPFLELLTSIELHDRLYLVIENEDEFISYHDFSRILIDQPVFRSGVTTWEELELMFTEELLTAYPAQVLVPAKCIYSETIDLVTRTYVKLTPFSSNILNQLNIFSVENNMGMDVAYTSRNSPYTRNVQAIKWTLKDLVFTHTGTSPVIDFANTIPIVNGLACYPKVWNGELFAYEGANLLRNIGSENKNLVLLDFSKVGELETHLLANCVNLSSFSTGTHTTSMTEDEGDVTKVKFVGDIELYDTDEFVIKVELPENASHGIPILCIGGRLFFPYEDKLGIKTVGEKRVVTFTLKRITLEKILAANLQKFGKQINNTGNINVDVNDFLDYLFVDHLGDYYTDQITEEASVRKYFADTCIPFISIIKSDSTLAFKKSTPIGTILPDKLQFEPNAGGLLINGATREVVDYVKIPYESCTLVTFADWKPLELIERDSPHGLAGKAFAGTKHNYQRKDAWNPFSLATDERDLNNYYLLDIGKV